MKSMSKILSYLKTHGEQFDKEISVATGISLADVQSSLAQLAYKSEIVTCYTVRFDKGKKVEGTIYRIAGYTPPAAPGRKSKAQLKLS